MLEHYVSQFTETAKKMGRNYVANIALEYVVAIMDEEGYTVSDKFKLVDAIHKAYAQVFVDDSLPWSTDEIYKPEPVETDPFYNQFAIENDPFAEGQLKEIK